MLLACWYYSRNVDSAGGSTSSGGSGSRSTDSSGATAGIIIGVLLAVAIIAALVYYYVMYVRGPSHAKYSSTAWESPNKSDHAANVGEDIVYTDKSPALLHLDTEMVSNPASGHGHVFNPDMDDNDDDTDVGSRLTSNPYSHPGRF